MSAYAWPVNPAFTPVGGGFGSWVLDNGKKRSSAHSGVDWARNAGEQIKAAHGGTVVYVRTTSTSGWGRFVWIRGDDGKFYGYAHMRDVPLVKVGQRVEVGTPLGYVGASGNVTGAHLHFVIAGGTWEQAFGLVLSTLIDPVAYISARLDPLLPHERQVKSSANVNVRVDPNPASREIAEIGPGQQFSPISYKPDGATVSGVSLWYAIRVPKEQDGDEVAWVWAGGTTEASGHDLPLYVEPTPPPVEPEPVEPPKPVVHTVTFGLPNGEVAVEVEHGEVVAPAAVPTPPYTTGYQFEGWLLAEDDPTVMPNTEIDLSTYRVLEDVLLHAWYKQEVIEPGEPAEPEVPAEPQVPVVDPQMQNLDDAATILADAASPWLSSGVRARVYEVATIGVAACGSIAGVAGAVVLVVGSDSQVGTVAGTTALIAAAVGGALGTFAARLARQNTPLEAAKRLEAQGDELGVRTVAKIRAANSK